MSFWYDMNVVNECDCLCHSQICADILGLHYYNDGKLRDLKAATAFQILCVYFKLISVEKKKSQLYCKLLDNINYMFRLT